MPIPEGVYANASLGLIVQIKKIFQDVGPTPNTTPSKSPNEQFGMQKKSCKQRASS